MAVSVVARSSLVHPARSASVLVAIAWVVRYLLWRFGARRPTGAPIYGHWLLGGALTVVPAVTRHYLHQLLLQVHQALGQTVVLLPPVPIREWWVMTTNPENVQHILKTNFDNYPKGEKLTAAMRELLGQGIFNVDGKEWYTQRKTTSHMFTAKLFKQHIWIVVNRNARKLRKVFENVEAGASVDVFNLMNRFTLDSIGEIGFGKCIGSLDDATSPFLKSFDRAQHSTMNRVVKGATWRIERWLGIGAERGAKEHYRRLDDYSRSVARDLQASFQKSGEKIGGVKWDDIDGRKSFVGLFLEDARKRGEHVSEDHLRDLVLNFLIAGRDTTAQALSWTIFCLCQHPKVEEKVRQEVRDVCNGGTCQYEDINKLTYMNAVLSESLRLYPSVPADVKRAAQDDIWPDGTKIPAGTNIIYNVYSMGRDTATWGEDAGEFKPERWLEMKEPPDDFHYPVFNGGPRVCLGRRLAMVEMKCCLAVLLPNLSLKLAVPADQISTDSQLTIGMASGLPCYVICNQQEDDANSNASTGMVADCSEGISECTSTAADIEETMELEA